MTKPVYIQTPHGRWVPLVTKPGGREDEKGVILPRNVPPNLSGKSGTGGTPDSTENVGLVRGVNSVEPGGAFERLRQFLKTDGVGGSTWGPQTIGEAFQGVVLSQPDLFAYWPMSEASGTLADLGPHNIPMIQSGSGATYGVAGPFPPLTAIDMNNTDYFAATITGTLANLIFGDASVGVRHPFTIAAIANMPALADASDAVFSAHAGADQISMYFTTAGGDNLLQLGRGTDGTAGVEQPINRNQLLVYRYDGTNMELFVDGTLVDTAVGNDALGAWGTTTMYIGAIGTGTPAKTQAILSNVALFTDAISDEVIAQLSAGFALGGTGGVLNIDHGGLYGLADDDHPQYHNNARGDARYPLLSLVTTIGDLLVGTASGVWARLGNGTQGYVLTADPSGASPKVKWANLALSAVTSIKKTGSAALVGDVTLTGGANVTLTQTGQDITVAATITGAGAVDSIAVQGDTPMVGAIEFIAGTGIALSQNDVHEMTISGGVGADGWFDDSANTWTFATASTFTVSGDRTTIFEKGVRLRYTQTTVKYAVVVASSHSAGTTTVTIMVNTDYTIANAAISANSYSRILSPQGFPGWFNWAPNPQGFSASVTPTFAVCRVDGHTCTIHAQWTGTSNATTHTFTLPVAPVRVNGLIQPAFGRNLSAALTSPSLLNNSGVNTTCQAYKGYDLSAWNNTGAKDLIFYATYDI